MLEKKLAGYFTNWCYRNYPMDEERTVAVKYGIEILLNTGLKFIGLFVLAALCGRVSEAFIAIICFSLLRTNAGGFHLHSSMGCFMGMCFIAGISVFLSERIFYLNLLGACIIILIITNLMYRYAPCSTSNNPIKNPRTVNKKKAYAVLTVWGIGAFILAIPDVKIKILLLIPLIIETISILPIFNMRNKYNR